MAYQIGIIVLYSNTGKHERFWECAIFLEPQKYIIWKNHKKFVVRISV